MWPTHQEPLRTYSHGDMTPFSHGITKRIANEDLSPFEYIFCWLGNTDLLVSIIKLIEDKMNLEHDVNEVGVQVILVVRTVSVFIHPYCPTSISSY